jgi:hypothetical protein
LKITVISKNIHGQFILEIHDSASDWCSNAGLAYTADVISQRWAAESRAIAAATETLHELRHNRIISPA